MNLSFPICKSELTAQLLMCYFITITLNILICYFLSLCFKIITNNSPAQEKVERLLDIESRDSRWVPGLQMCLLKPAM